MSRYQQRQHQVDEEEDEEVDDDVEGGEEEVEDAIIITPPVKHMELYYQLKPPKESLVESGFVGFQKYNLHHHRIHMEFSTARERAQLEIISAPIFPPKIAAKIPRAYIVAIGLFSYYCKGNTAVGVNIRESVSPSLENHRAMSRLSGDHVHTNTTNAAITSPTKSTDELDEDDDGPNLFSPSVRLNDTRYLFTMFPESTQYKVHELLFQPKPANLQTMFPFHKCKDITKGVSKEQPDMAKKNMVYKLKTDIDPKTGEPYCPLGYFKNQLTASSSTRNSPKPDIFCLEEAEYNELLETFKLVVIDSRVAVNTKNLTLHVFPEKAKPGEFKCGIVLDVYFSQQL